MRFLTLTAACLTAASLAACSSSDRSREPRTDAEPAVLAPPKLADPAFLEQYAETFRFRLGRPSKIALTPKGDAVLFLRSSPRSFVNDLWSFDPATGEERRLLTAEEILQGGAERLSAEELARRERMRQAARGIASFQLSKDGERILVPLSERLFVIERRTGKVKELPAEGGSPSDPRFSPDGQKVAVVRDGDLWVIEVESGNQRRLTTRSSPTVTNGLAEFVAQEEMDRFEGYWWSPGGKLIAFEEADTQGVENAYIADPTKPQAEPQSWPYPRPGKQNVSVRLGIAPVTGGKPVWVSWDRDRYPYLAKVTWQEEAPLSLLVQNRAQTESVLLAVQASTGETRTLLTEKDSAWVNLDQDVPRWLPDGEGFLWTTERNGAWQLELHDRDGGLVRALTAPDLGYRRLLAVDGKRKTAIVAASPNATERQLYQVSLGASESGAPSEPKALTTDPGEHDATFAADHSLYVHTLSSLAGEQRFTVRRGDGHPFGELRSVAEAPAFLPNLELVELASEHAMRAALVRPRNFDPKLRYPVIVYVYAGPHAQVVTAAREKWLLQQWIADHGFVVVSVDGRGTPARGRAWERAIHGNLIDVPLADQVAGLKALGARFPELDMERVGIYGWSFGGYFSSMAAMQRPDVYKAAVAGAPVADWLDYDTHYTERYLGLPQANPEGYRKSSVLSYASELSRPFLLIHGTADDNVYFAHALKMSDALFRAGKRHDFLPLAGFTHMVPDPLVTTRLYTRITSFFEEHLGAPVAQP
ncbi:S9 family peptidase [Vulgatibacter incomptus]|uniref:Dipeptidyl peptidase IV n=1 Tax=Vulgatibacter incomptus TaxID=1391653 RepID=A0A0K1PGI3_9BACT|nr:S9 family peptidase [Vulgatibacter incomptus]AKU92204.1 Dipeptidyl peptidase IV [Vulgatibacter incomptus]